jgi:hypothetical protein
MHEPCVAVRQRDAHAGAGCRPLARLQVQVRSEVQITPRIAGVSAVRDWQIWIEPPDQHLDRSGLAAGTRHLNVLRGATPGWPDRTPEG